MVCKKIVRGEYRELLNDKCPQVSFYMKGDSNPVRIEDLLKEFVDKRVRITIEEVRQ